MKLACDVHTHTLYSRHAYSTIQENIEAAHVRGLELLGSADHFSTMLYPEQDYRNFQYFINVSSWPRIWDGVVLLRACEADIVDLEGHLFGWDIEIPSAINGDGFKRHSTLKKLVFRDLDYVVASVHGRDFCKGASLAQTTAMYIGALQDPKVAIIGHPGRAQVPFELDPVLCEAKRLGKMIEINGHSFDLNGSGKVATSCQSIAERCAELGVQIAVNTDAHIATDIGHFERTQELLERIHFPEELIATRSKDAFLGALRTAGIADIRPEEGKIR